MTPALVALVLLPFVPLAVWLARKIQESIDHGGS